MNFVERKKIDSFGLRNTINRQSFKNVIQTYKKTLTKVYKNLGSKSEEKRLNTLSGILYAMIKSGESSLQSLGTHYQDITDLESRIKKVKRWLDSKYCDFDTYYLPYVTLLFNAMPSNQPLIIAIDGSEVGNGHTVLMLSLIYKKRSLPLCWLFKQGKKGHWSEELHIALLEHLQQLLVTSHQVVILGDGEFDGCKLQDYCQSNHWNYVFRTAKNSLIETQHGDCFTIGSVYPMPQQEYYFIEDIYFTKQRFGVINGLIWHSQKHEASIYLLSNLDWPKDIMDYYQKRFAIETLFGDLKSIGFNINKVRIKNTERLNKLFMVVCLAF